STMVVRLLTPSPARSEAPSAAPNVEAPSEPVDRGAEMPRAARGRTSHVAAASAIPSTSRPSAAPSTPAAPESEYLAASRLDHGPKLLDDVDPVYPPEAGLTQGSVVLRLLIGTTGTVDEVTVVRAAPKGV